MPSNIYFLDVANLKKNKQNTWQVDVDYGTFKPSKTQGMYTERDN